LAARVLQWRQWQTYLSPLNALNISGSGGTIESFTHMLPRQRPYIGIDNVNIDHYT
jgi:hypothetical protein